MGGLCSKQNLYAGKEKLHNVKKDVSSKVVMTPTSMQKTIEKENEVKESPRLLAMNVNVNDDEFYDGIPRYRKNISLKSRSLKVSEVSARLGRAGSVGLGRAVEVLDTLGSSVNNLNLTGGFVSGATNKSNELSILSFEVANTIVKGSNLLQSLSPRSIRTLKDAVLPEKGIQLLISEDMDELLRIVASDLREDLKVFSEEVIRFGNRCKDPQWHNLDRFFEKRSRDRTSRMSSRDVAEAVMFQLMNSVQLTAELYQGMHTVDILEENYRKRLEDLKYNATQRGDRDNRVNLLTSKMKNQRKLVKSLKKKSLWSRSMEEVMEKLVDIVLFLNQEISATLGNPEGEETEKEPVICRQRLGPTGLALHYANIILQIDSIVARSGPMLPSSRDTLYQSLPPNVKTSLRSKLSSFHVETEVTVTAIKDEMEKTLCWLVPIATNTAKAHHGFGWVGEWANTGSDLNRRTVGPIDVMQIETLHHTDRQKTEAYIIDLLLWLNYLVSRSKVKARSLKRPSLRLNVHSPGKEADEQPNTEVATSATPTEEFVKEVNCKNEPQELSSDHDLGSEEEKMDENDGLNLEEKHSTGDAFVNLRLGDEDSLDMIDGVDTHV